MPDELLPVATFVKPAEAMAARLALETQGITCFLKDENIVSMDWLLGNAVGYVKLVVRASDALRAREVLDTHFDDWPSFTQGPTWKCPQCGEEAEKRFDKCPHCGTARPSNRQATAGPNEEKEFIQSLRNRDEAQRQAGNPYAPPRSEAAAVEIPGAEADVNTDDVAEGQARCPACGRTRVAVCPFCRTTGTRFRAADMMEMDDANEEPALLICPTCDEPFEPAYLRRCEWCGHDFGTGIEPPEIVRPLQTEPLNGRVLLAIAGGLAMVAAIVVYFAVLLS
ncbi:MAG TPA: hypothetical protein VNH11_18475 [Pirellulales bacterium]|nr:hypothetical protein [Pirellulales bacterium]